MGSRLLLFACLLIGSMTGLAIAPVALAQDIAASPDITLEVGPSNLLVVDENVVIDDLAASVSLEDLGTLPEATEVNAFGFASNGDRLFCLSTTAELPGAVTVTPRDVVRWDGAVYTIDFDSAAAGVPAGARIDAIAATATDWTLSFDTTVDLGPFVADDEDLVLWNGAVFSLVFDGSVEGLGTETDVDAVHDLGGGDYLLSLDTSADISGVFVDDEDLLRFESGTGFSLELDTSTADVDWEAADLDALELVPEPGMWVGLAAGIGLLGLLARRREL